MPRRYETAEPNRRRRQHALTRASTSSSLANAANGSASEPAKTRIRRGGDPAPTRTLPSPVRRVPSRDPGRCSGPRDPPHPPCRTYRPGLGRHRKANVVVVVPAAMPDGGHVPPPRLYTRPVAIGRGNPQPFRAQRRVPPTWAAHDARWFLPGVRRTNDARGARPDRSRAISR